MPDWFYRTVSRPLLFRMPAATARSFALGFMGALARLPFGPALIDFLGHMRADPRLRRTVLGVSFPTPVGLGPWLDPDVLALPALARFGIGFVEIGPVTIDPITRADPVQRHIDDEALVFPAAPANPGAARLQAMLALDQPLGVPILVRIACSVTAPPNQAADELRRLVERLGPRADFLTLAAPAAALADQWSPDQWRELLASTRRAAEDVASSRPLLLAVPCDLSEADSARLIGSALAVGFSGVLLDGAVRVEGGGRLVGRAAREAAFTLVWQLRSRWGNDCFVVAAGGVHEPEDALALLTAGADLVQIDSGLVYTGPGLPKRINEALLAALPAPAAPAEPLRPTEANWFWAALMGAGMVIGSLLALAIALTRVVLPYDEIFSGLSRAQLHAANERLLAFMAHDRVSLAGTMIAIGVMYVGLSLGGMRRGLHWAQQSVFASAFAGFATFFLFLGYGYFDPFHAFVTAILFQFLLLALHCRLPPIVAGPPPAPRGDGRWRRGLWGQLLLIVHACALLGAGVVICSIGATTVFVHEDLEFMRTTAEELRAVSPRLVPLIAHDRATFGGMLVASGLVFLLPALWGFREHSAWLWWTMLLAGLPAYAAAIGIHHAVGYENWWHLAPAYGGLLLFAAGLGLARPYICSPGGRGSGRA